MAINGGYLTKQTKTFLLLGLFVSGLYVRPVRADNLDKAVHLSVIAHQTAGAVNQLAWTALACWIIMEAVNYKNRKSAIGTLATNTKVTFKDVAGAQQAKEALEDIVGFLQDPAKYNQLGAKMSKGVLLTGEPGNGKTLLARAVAGEANCAFYSITGTELISKFYGEGPERVRELFAKAKENAPSIIFIDEIDVIGADRSASTHEGGGAAYREILNQLLTCMDGFEQSSQPVVVIAATNIPQVLDPALKRPGRFDQVVKVSNPDLSARVELLNIYLKKISASSDLDVNKIARGTIGFSGAELANLVNEAAMLATKRNALEVEMVDFEEARDRTILGVQSKTMVLSEEERKITAYHEAGHAMVTLMVPDLLDPLHKVTITPRGNALGVTYSLPEEEQHSINKEKLLAQITMCCGGRAAEELVFGKITTGAHSDFDKATNIARSMVCECGMSDEIGMAVYKQKYGALTCSPAMAEKIDLAVNKIIQDCYARAKQILIEHSDKFEQLAQALLEKETLQASEIYELLGLQPRTDLKIC